MIATTVEGKTVSLPAVQLRGWMDAADWLDGLAERYDVQTYHEIAADLRAKAERELAPLITADR